MEILYLSDSRVPSTSANSVNVVKMCSAMSAHHQVTLYCYSDRSATDAHIREYYGVSGEFNRLSLPDVRIPGIRRTLRLLSVWRFLRAMPRADLVYGRDVYGLLLASRFGLPVIFEAHVPPRNRIEHLTISRLISSPRFRRLVVISDALNQEFRRLFPGLSAESVVTAHDAADVAQRTDTEPDSSIARESAPWRIRADRSEALQLGYVGSLYPGKGAELLPKLAKALPQHDFHIVGGDQKTIDALKDGVNCTNLHYHGHVPHSAVSAYLHAFDVLLFPMQASIRLPSGSDIGRWTSPLKLFEYMATGKPIIGSNLEIVREILRDDDNALLADPDDLAQWCAAVERLQKDLNLRDRLGKAARNDLEIRHTWSKRVEDVIPDGNYEGLAAGLELDKTLGREQESSALGARRSSGRGTSA